MTTEKEKYLPGYSRRRDQLYRLLNILWIITILFNLIRGIISILISLVEGSVALFGFGCDSLVETVYIAVMWNITRRLREDSFVDIEASERKALKNSGISFYALSACLVVISIINISRGYKPRETFQGVVISLISLLILSAIFYYKKMAGQKLNSEIVTSDAEFTKISMGSALILLFSGLGYELIGAGFFDSAGTMLLGITSFIKAKEILKKIPPPPENINEQ